MRNYFKAFATTIDKFSGRTIIGPQRLAFFDDESAEETATAYAAVQAFQKEVKGARISVWRHPRCSKAWDDVRVIGDAPEVPLAGLEARNAAHAEAPFEDRPAPPDINQ